MIRLLGAEDGPAWRGFRLDMLSRETLACCSAHADIARLPRHMRHDGVYSDAIRVCGCRSRDAY